MKYPMRWICPLLALLVVGPVFAAEKKDKNAPQTKDTVKNSGKFSGELILVENTTKNFTVKVTYYTVDPNELQKLINYDTQRKLEMSRIVNRLELVKQLNAHAVEIEKRKQGIYKKQTADIELEADDETKVRTMVLPVEYDDKGKPKKFTPKELRELKGPNKKLPGYTADWDNLGKGQLVEVYIPKPKKPKTKPKTKDKDKEDEDKELFKDKPKAIMIVILKETPPNK
jgi:hypothetical protein